MNTMMTKPTIQITALLVGLLLCGACTRTETEATTNEHGAMHEAETVTKGPHGGRLLGDKPFQLEVSIYETNVEPEYRLYGYSNGKPLMPTEITARIELERFGQRKDVFSFTPKQDYLLGSMVVEEPHSFMVKVSAEHAGKTYAWSYESYEGRARIAADMAQTSGISTAVAGPGPIRKTIVLYGTIQPNAERVRTVSARFPGVTRKLNKELGDVVKAGEVLATVESNESLQTYAITAPISGVITERHTNVGETTEGTLFVIADHTRVWAVLGVFPRDRPQLKTGQPVAIAAAEGSTATSASIASIVAGAAHNSGLVARVELDNKDGRWVPGQFVNGTVVVAEQRVDVAVPERALQTFRDWDVVYLNEGEIYQAMPVTLGRRDGQRVEVLSGLAAGQRYVSDGSYLLKADVEKSGASHDH